MKDKFFRIAFLYLFLSATLIHASSQPVVPFEIQAVLFYKFLIYDQNMENYKKNPLTVAILVDEGSKSQLESIQKGFMYLNGKILHQKTVRVIVLHCEDPKHLANQVTQAHARFLYLPASTRESTLKAALNLARQKRFPTLGGSAELVSKGVSVGMTIEAQRPRIVVNLREAKAQGLKPRAQVLQLSKVIR